MNLNVIQAPTGLLERVLNRIALARRRGAQMRIVVFLLVATSSLAALIPAIGYAMNEVYASGFYSYFSLLFSDSSVVLSHWQMIFLTLAESLPSISLLLLIAVMSVLILSVNQVLKNAQFALSGIHV